MQTVEAHRKEGSRGSGRAAPGRGRPFGPASRDSKLSDPNDRSSRKPTHSRPVLVFPVRGARTVTVMAPGCATFPARRSRPMTSAKRGQQEHRPADPVGQGRAIKSDALAVIDAGLAVQRCDERIHPTTRPTRQVDLDHPRPLVRRRTCMHTANLRPLSRQLQSGLTGPRNCTFNLGPMQASVLIETPLMRWPRL